MSETGSETEGLTKEQIFAEWGCSVRAGEKMLTEAVSKGLFRVEWVAFKDRTGRSNRRPCYFPETPSS